MRYLMNDNGDMYSFSVHKEPVFKVDKQKDWLLWGHVIDYKNQDATKWNNRLPDYYEWLYNSSSKHRAIINRKVTFIVGKGLNVEYIGQDLPEKIELTAFAHKLNDRDFVDDISRSFVKIGAFAFQVIPDKGKSKIDIHYVNFKNLRRSKPEYKDKKEVPLTWYYTADWSTKNPKENEDYLEFHEWDWTDKFEDGKNYIVTHYENQETLYPIPEYTACIPYISADFEVANFVNNNVKNGMTAGWLVNVFGTDPDDEMKGKVAKMWKQRLHGTDNSGEPIISFQDAGVEGVQVTPLNPNGQDDRFINLNKQIREEIFSGHMVDPVVVGLEGNNGFNNNADEKRTAIEDFQNYYVRPKQQKIEQYLNAVKNFNGLKGKILLERLDPIMPQFSSSDVLQIAEKNEIRAFVGLDKLTDKQTDLAQKLGLLNPLVASAIIQRLGNKELLSIVGITEPQVNTTTTTSSRFSKEQEDNLICAYFETCGIDDSEYEVISERELFAKDIEDAESQQYDFATKAETSILSLLKAQPGISNKELSELLKINENDVADIVNKLKADGLISDEGTITNKGNEEINKGELITVYKYALRNDVIGADVIDTTRDFCKRMVRLSRNRSWTLKEIKAMSNGMGLDVFRSRGGWYTLPGTNTHVPYCRHIWVQKLVRKK